ncbi:MAG: glycosyltransferase family 2 protein [Acidobacteriota bacterium]|nr:glycosyltransferase family 2 protein [Acidobacteriota bacterium]
MSRILKLYSAGGFLLLIMIMYQPKISIIVPAYNVQAYLKQCLDSLINQTFLDMEIILLNDGSTDDTPKICDRYALKDQRIRIIHKKNSGLSDTRNQGIEYATGKYIMFVDADDWIERNTCEIAYKTAVETDVDVLLWSYIREHRRRSIKKRIDLRKGLYSGPELKYYLQRRMVGLLSQELRYPENADAISVVWAKLYKSEVIKPRNVRFVDTKKVGSAEDPLFNLYAFENAMTAFYFDFHLYHYRRFTGVSFTNAYKPWLFERWQKLYKYMELFIKENNLPEYFFEALDNRRCLSIIGLGLTELSDYNKKTVAKKIKYLGGVLKHPEYKAAYKKMKLKYLIIRPQWFLFFFFCKKNFSLGVYTLLFFMKYLKRII